MSHTISHHYLEFEQRRQYLLQYGPDIFEWQRAEFVLLEKIVEVLFQHLEDETGVVLVLKALEGPDEIEFVRILLT